MAIASVVIRKPLDASIFPNVSVNILKLGLMKWESQWVMVEIEIATNAPKGRKKGIKNPLKKSYSTTAPKSINGTPTTNDCFAFLIHGIIKFLNRIVCIG